MEAQLLVCVRLRREKFLYEDFTPEDHILALVKSGNFTLRPEGGAQETVGAGEAAWFHRGVRYLRRIGEPAEFYLFRFRAEGALYGGHKLSFRDKRRIASTLELLEQLDDRLCEQDFQYRNALFQDLLTQFAIESRQRMFEGIGDPVIVDAVERLKQSLHRKLSLERFASSYGITYVHFSRRFKAAMGTTPSQFLLGLRLQKARTMLADTDLPIFQIAQECGFENEYYFSNCFKKHCGLPPSSYRRDLQSNR